MGRHRRTLLFDFTQVASHVFTVVFCGLVGSFVGVILTQTVICSISKKTTCPYSRIFIFSAIPFRAITLVALIAFTYLPQLLVNTSFMNVLFASYIRIRWIYMLLYIFTITLLIAALLVWEIHLHLFVRKTPLSLHLILLARMSILVVFVLSITSTFFMLHTSLPLAKITWRAIQRIQFNDLFIVIIIISVLLLIIDTAIGFVHFLISKRDL